MINNQARIPKSKTLVCGQAVIVEAGLGLCEEKMVVSPDSPGAKIYCPCAKWAAKKLKLSGITKYSCGKQGRGGTDPPISRKAITKEEININERVTESRVRRKSQTVIKSLSSENSGPWLRF